MSKKTQKSKVDNPDFENLPLKRYYENLPNATRIIAAKPKEEFLNEIANLTGRTPETVRTWCLGTNTPAPHVQEKIAKFMRTSVASLFPETV